MLSLSDLTTEKVDHLFHIDRAKPHTAPVFLLMVGLPGVGKSSGHREAIKREYVPKHDYATINLDTLIESLKVFRSASSMAHLLKQKDHESVKFGTITAYTSKKNDFGLFKWYDDISKSLKPAMSRRLSKIRNRYTSKTAEQPHNVQELADLAIQRAIDKSVNIVYETTLSATKAGKVTKIDELMKKLEKATHPYTVILLHVRAPVADVSTRIKHRQEYKTPYLNVPFYRFMTPSHTVLTSIDTGIHRAIKVIEETYPEIEISAYDVPMNASKLPKSKQFSTRKQLRKLSTVFESPKNRSGYSANIDRGNNSSNNNNNNNNNNNE